MDNWLWIVFTLIAAAAQTVRNAAQRELTGKIGTVGATHVRFLFGLPFGILFLILLVLATDASLPNPGVVFWPWVFLGAVTQITATALMLAAMGERSFVVVYAYIKTEPIQVALFGLIFLGDRITPTMTIAIMIATVGVLLMSLTNSKALGELKSTLLGLAAGSAFAFSSIGFRGAILSLHDSNFVMSATFTVVIGLAIQVALISIYLFTYDRAVLIGIIKAWRPSLLAGFLGALASQFWFLGFATATAASVRTLALVEVLFAQGISRFVFKQPTTMREGIGIVLIVTGVGLLIWAY